MCATMYLVFGRAIFLSDHYWCVGDLIRPVSVHVYQGSSQLADHFNSESALVAGFLLSCWLQLS